MRLDPLALLAATLGAIAMASVTTRALTDRPSALVASAAGAIALLGLGATAELAAILPAAAVAVALAALTWRPGLASEIAVAALALGLAAFAPAASLAVLVALSASAPLPRALVAVALTAALLLLRGQGAVVVVTAIVACLVAALIPRLPALTAPPGPRVCAALARAGAAAGIVTLLVVRGAEGPALATIALGAMAALLGGVAAIAIVGGATLLCASDPARGHLLALTLAAAAAGAAWPDALVALVAIPASLCAGVGISRARGWLVARSPGWAWVQPKRG